MQEKITAAPRTIRIVAGVPAPSGPWAAFLSVFERKAAHSLAGRVIQVGLAVESTV